MIRSMTIFAAISMAGIFLLPQLATAQNVGIGTTTPATKLHISGSYSSPAIPGVTSTGIFRIGVSSNEGIDFGKLDISPFSAWMQAGFNGLEPDPLSLQPVGGSVGIGTVAPAATAVLDIASTTKGFLPPRMTKAQRDAIANPADGLMISCTNCNVAGLQQYINGSWQVLMTSSTGIYGTVVNPVTGKVWLDRNLGATQVATSSTDAASYGDLYQWGRGEDGHQVRTSSNTTTQATNWLSGGAGLNGLFITSFGNWISTDETHMWSGTAAENNPCPSGFRVPTNAEWYQERLTWTTNNAAGAFASPLKLPMAGYRLYFDGSLQSVDTKGGYWSSTVSSIYSRHLNFTGSNALLANELRANGFCVRCIKD